MITNTICVNPFLIDILRYQRQVNFISKEGLWLVVPGAQCPRRITQIGVLEQRAEHVLGATLLQSRKPETVTPSTLQV